MPPGASHERQTVLHSVTGNGEGMREGGNEDGYFRADRAFLVLSAFIWLASPACADSGSDYKAGSDFCRNRCRAMKSELTEKFQW